MDEIDRVQLYNTAWKHYGSQAQLDILIEEMAELTQAIIKTRRQGVTYSYRLYEELADVLICLEQLETQLRRSPRAHATKHQDGFDFDTVLELKNMKLERFKAVLMADMAKELPDGFGDRL